MRRVKAALDPAGLLNPGKVLQAGAMTKILLWIVVDLRGAVRAPSAERRQGEAARGPRPPAMHRGRRPPETMVRCARCGVYLPRADAKPGPAGLTCGDPGCAQRR